MNTFATDFQTVVIKIGVMTIGDIKRLVAVYEPRTLVVKKSTGELKDGMHAACAFLNAYSGWLIFGVRCEQGLLALKVCMKMDRR